MTNIKLLILDIDGTMTDGKIYMSAQGELFKSFNIKDGCGIRELLPRAGIIPVIMTGRDSPIVLNRCKEIGIDHCYQGCKDKEAKLAEIAEQFRLQLDVHRIYQDIAYMGDDLPDLPCMQRCGLVGCPADAVDEVKKVAHYIATKRGGEGAVREFIEWMIDQ